MNNLKLPGQLIGQIRPKCQERSVSFKKIVSLLNNNELHKPKFQIDLDEDKIDEMCKSYNKNRDFLIFKNKIVIGVIVNKYSPSEINYKMYVIDGQHRLEMAKKLIEESNNDEDKNDFLTFCYYETNSDKEMKELFIEINKDSHKNSKYISLDDFNQNIYDELKLYLHKEKSLYFSPKKKETSKLFTISEFVDKISEKKYDSLEAIKEELESKNKIFYKKIDYKEYLIEDPTCFYSEEKTAIDNGYIIGLKNNNFIDFLFNKDIPDHKFKKQKDKISPKLRILVWTRWFGEKSNTECPLCKENIKIGKNGFHCGHIKSEANGGETILENLRPLCGTCNVKMNSMNWEDYEKTLKLKKVLIKNDKILPKNNIKQIFK